MSWIKRIDQWTKNLIVRTSTRGNDAKRSRSRIARTIAQNVKPNIKSIRHSIVESLETRALFNVDPLWVGGVYVEEDQGDDEHGDSFYITFRGGAPGTQLTRLIIDTDQNSSGFSNGDNFFDVTEGASNLGADHAFPFHITSIVAQNPNAMVRSQVSDGGMQLILTFENFYAGDKVKFSIDVDEVQRFRGNPSPDAMNPDIDPITSGVEFADSKLKASFIAPRFEDANAEGLFVNAYDPILVPSGLDLPGDDRAGLRDRTAGAVASVTQIPKPIELSGTVYVDNNLSLTQDAGETGIGGVTLSLYRLEGSTYVSTGFTTTTDAQGKYQFGLSLGLPPGTYQVREVQPVGYFSVGAVPGLLDGQPTLGKVAAGDKDTLTDIAILQGDSRGTRLDFAEAQPVSLCGFVYRDNNDNGVREPGEAGIANVEIQITSIESVAGTISQTIRTESDGSYCFIGLPPGRYRVRQVTQPTGFFDGKDTPGKVGSQTRGVSDVNDQITEIRLHGSENGIEFNFGEVEPSSLAGHVCMALPGYDCFSTEPGSDVPLAGVRIDLLNQSGQIVATTVTAEDGTYHFDQLPAGVYHIVETQPVGLLDGLSRAGEINGIQVGNAVSGTRIESIVLQGGQHGIEYEFCELPPASLSGHVYQDDNDDGFRQGDESPLAGVTVRLFHENGALVAETVTDENGAYLFSNLRKGTYRISEITPAGYLDGKESIGRINGGIVGQLEGTDSIRSIMLPSGMDGIDYDFGEILPASLAGNIYEDMDGDCMRDDGEPPLSGVLVELLNEQGIVISSTHTDEFGNYKFEDLKPGVYTIREEQPQGYIQGGQMAGTAGGDDSIADIISSIVLGAGIDATHYDFCEQRVASLEGSVFADLDEDCIWDSDEAPIAGVRIELIDDAGNVIDVTFTDANGNYRFDNLKPGTYSVRETQPDGYFQGGQMAPEGIGDISIADLISQIVLRSGDGIEHLDFCEVPPATISGYVFQDGEPIPTKDGTPPLILKGLRDGVFNEGDTPISGVTLELRTRTGQPLGSQNALPGTYLGNTIRVVTNQNGFYEFRGLRPGAYHVYQTQPQGYYDGRDTAGSVGGFAVNADDTLTEVEQQNIIEMLAMDTATNPRHDAILMINLAAGSVSTQNNFSEIVVTKLPVIEQPPQTPAPPPPPPAPPISPSPTFGTVPPPVERMLIMAPPVIGKPDEPIGGLYTEYTWHLSVINAGEPRGHRVDKHVSRTRVANAAKILNATQWTIDSIDRGRWVIVSTAKNKSSRLSREAFDVYGAKQLAGDFNGDGRDELALFKDGEWLLDINGNGVWDKGDLWAKLGEEGDLPVVGDWDNDGKDDIGIFGPEWEGDDEALQHEPGLPDPDNRMVSSPKNLPPREIDPKRERLMQRSIEGEPRSDVIDHVFRFGKSDDQPVAGDFNGDGVSTVGVFSNGQWKIDVNGDGRFTESEDSFFDFGEPGDIAVVGDFNGDGFDEIAVVRGRTLIIDSNGNGQFDATDRVFEIEGAPGPVVVGDFDGDGIDEAAFYSATQSTRTEPDAKTARR